MQSLWEIQAQKGTMLETYWSSPWFSTKLEMSLQLCTRCLFPYSFCASSNTFQQTSSAGSSMVIPNSNHVEILTNAEIECFRRLLSEILITPLPICQVRYSFYKLFQFFIIQLTLVTDSCEFDHIMSISSLFSSCHLFGRNKVRVTDGSYPVFGKGDISMKKHYPCHLFSMFQICQIIFSLLAVSVNI